MNVQQSVNALSTERVTVIIAFAFLSGCAGDSGDSTKEQSARALIDIHASADQLVAAYSPITYTDLDAIPTTGTVTYDGFISGQLGNTTDQVADSLIGRLAIEVTFGSSEMVTGSAWGFLDEQGNQLDGNLALSGGILDRDGDPNTDATFLFEGTGELISIEDQTIQLDTVFEGDFLGEELDGLGGDVLGQATIDGVSQPFGGFFIANQ